MYYTHIKLVANYLESLGKVFVCYQNWPIFRLLLLTELPLKNGKMKNEKKWKYFFVAKSKNTKKYMNK